MKLLLFLIAGLAYGQVCEVQTYSTDCSEEEVSVLNQGELTSYLRDFGLSEGALQEFESELCPGGRAEDHDTLWSCIGANGS